MINSHENEAGLDEKQFRETCIENSHYYVFFNFGTQSEITLFSKDYILQKEARRLKGKASTVLVINNKKLQIRLLYTKFL